jgi:hypothetical protein
MAGQLLARAASKWFLELVRNIAIVGVLRAERAGNDGTCQDDSNASDQQKLLEHGHTSTRNRSEAGVIAPPRIGGSLPRGARMARQQGICAQELQPDPTPYLWVAESR